MKNKLILVVEDNPDHLELTVLTLQDHGVKAPRSEAGARRTRDGDVADLRRAVQEYDPIWHV